MTVESNLILIQALQAQVNTIQVQVSEIEVRVNTLIFTTSSIVGGTGSTLADTRLDEIGIAETKAKLVADKGKK